MSRFSVVVICIAALAIVAGAVIAGARFAGSSELAAEAETGVSVAVNESEMEDEALAEEPAVRPRVAPSEPWPEARAQREPAPVASASAVAPMALPQPSAAPSATPEQVQVALRATPIVMYSTPWCGVCRHARAFFHANGLSFDERDIEASERYRADLLRLSGGTSVPFIDIDGAELRGFSEQSSMAAIQSSVQRRLGISNLSVQPR